ncbi:hypothetical protein T01_5607 [Trichinella spiralis]|uniref:Uncharacterized protein n=1 Tax=Trichinella spiralis TaxID=6334 RepID=A0A0V1B914_TRISP|nr:hypothetical protein T01_5607 [Trichinella spiralis]
MKQNSASDEIREQICVRLYKIRNVIFLRVSCYSRAFNIRLLLSFPTCSGAKPVKLHGDYWHILQGNWYFLSWFLLTHEAKHGERERAKQLFDVVEVPRQENSEKTHAVGLLIPFQKGALQRREPVHDIQLVGGGGLSAIIRLENKLPQTPTGHPMNLLTACRCP